VAWHVFTHAFLTDAQLADTGRKILEPFMRGCAAEGIDYRGILYPGSY